MEKMGTRLWGKFSGTWCRLQKDDHHGRCRQNRRSIKYTHVFVSVLEVLERKCVIYWLVFLSLLFFERK